MKTIILGDYAVGDGMQEILSELDKTPFNRFLSAAGYGPGIETICIGIRCLPSEYAGRSRTRFTKTDKFYGGDLRIVRESFIGLSEIDKRRIVAEHLQCWFLPALGRAKIKEFDCERFTHDFSSWINSFGWK